MAFWLSALPKVYFRCVSYLLKETEPVPSPELDLLRSIFQLFKCFFMFNWLINEVAAYNHLMLVNPFEFLEKQILYKKRLDVSARCSCCTLITKAGWR